MTEDLTQKQGNGIERWQTRSTHRRLVLRKFAGPITNQSNYQADTARFIFDSQLKNNSIIKTYCDKNLSPQISRCS